MESISGREAAKKSIQVAKKVKGNGTYWWLPGEEQIFDKAHFYVPEVPDISKVKLPKTIELVVEALLAPQTQEKWAETAIKSGQTYETNPMLIPYHMLNEEQKREVRASSLLSFQILKYQGFDIKIPQYTLDVALELQEKMKAAENRPYSLENRPNPVNVDFVKVSPAMKLLTYQLANYQHQRWAKEKVDKGWHYNPVRDNDKKRHPDLMPTEHLTPKQIEYDLVFATYAVQATIFVGGAVTLEQESNHAKRLAKLFKIA